MPHDTIIDHEDRAVAARRTGLNRERVIAVGALLAAVLAPAALAESPFEAVFHDVARPVVANPQAVATGDLNADGLPDLVFANHGWQSFSVRLGPVDAPDAVMFGTHLTGNADDLAVGDLDGDGALDVVVAHAASNALSILRGRGDGTFETPSILTGVNWPTRVQLADVDADGALDLLVINFGADAVSVRPGLGDGTFAAPMS